MALPSRTPTKVAPESRYTPSFEGGDLPARAWHPATLAAFRFGVVYFGLYILTTQMLGALIVIPGVELPPLQAFPPVKTVVLWVGAHVFAIAKPIGVAETGSGDRTFDWLHAFTLLAIAVLSTVVWTSVARDKQEQSKLFARFRLFLRLAVGTTMLGYGMAKVIPLQMPTGTLSKLVEPFGNFSPMGVLWYSIGASPAYETFVGLAEVCGGVLLIIPITAPLGALMCLMNTIEVFTLNMTYDVPVKLFSFHLIVMSAFLAAPNAPRLFDFFLRRRAAHVREEPSLGGSSKARRTILAAQLVYVGWVVLSLGGTSIVSSARFGDGAPKPALYGIWNVEHLTVDGQQRALAVTDSALWRRFVFQRVGYTTLQRMNDSLINYRSTLDTLKNTLTLTASDSAKTVSSLAYQRPTKDRLVLDGSLDGRAVHMELSYRDPNTYLQRSRGFHWISEVPFNR